MKFILASCFALLFSGCSALTDPAPSAPQPVTHIQDYYLPLQHIGASYAYCRKSQYGADTIQMTMQGNDAMGMMRGNKQCYAADLKTDYFFNSYFFLMNDTEACTLGSISCYGAETKWLDLKAPLMLGQQWTFVQSGGYKENTYTAAVTKRGAQMKMPDGTIYNDVIEVIYTRGASDSTVKWFTKGIGLIYSTSTNPDNDFGQEMRLLSKP